MILSFREPIKNINLCIELKTQRVLLSYSNWNNLIFKYQIVLMKELLNLMN